MSGSTLAAALAIGRLKRRGASGGGRGAIFIWVRTKRLTVERNLIVGCDRAGAGADGLARQVEVLRHVTGVDEQHPVGREAVPPLHAIGYGCPDKRHSASGDKTLPEAGIGQAPLHVLHFAHKQKFV